MLIEVIMFVWFIMLGACVGSFLNVVILRLPEGTDVVFKPSHCPVCGHKLAWYDNIPLISWMILLRGKCRYCGTRISAQYPIIEGMVAGLFGLIFTVFYFTPYWPAMSSEQAGFIATWPIYLCFAFTFATLVAITVIDLRYYVVVVPVPWVMILFVMLTMTFTAAISPNAMTRVILPAVTLVNQDPEIRLKQVGEPMNHDYRVKTGIMLDEPELEGQLINPNGSRSAVWITMLPMAGVTGTGLGLGGLVGWILSLLLLRLKVLPRSMEDEKESENITEENALEPKPQIHEDPEAFNESLGNMRLEVLKEFLFLIPIMLGMAIGAYFIEETFFTGMGAAMQRAVMTFGSVCLGVLVGGGIIWITRIVGTLAFGREAMGLGDTHIMALIGAVGGWELALLTFFLAPFFGLLYALITMSLQSVIKKSFRVLPYGPHLSLGALTAVLLWPWLSGFFGTRLIIFVTILMGQA